MLLLQAIVECLESEEQIKTAEQIFMDYRNAMYQISYQILKNTHDAEEAVGDTIVKVCRHIDDFTVKPENERKLLMKKYTEYTAIDLLRRRARMSTEQLKEDMLADMDNDGEDFGEKFDEKDDILFNVEDFGCLQKYVATLPIKYKDILIMKYVNHMKNTEIAELVHIPESTVSTQLVRARKRLEAMLKEGGRVEWRK